MKKDDTIANRKNLIIISVIIVSIILYLAGVFSGLYANNIVKKETTENLNILKSETEKDIQDLKKVTEEDLIFLKDYISILENNVKSTQLEQIFLETLNQEQRCEFSTIAMDNLLNEMKFFWEKLPFRIEEYEKNNPLTEDYLLLKQQYTDLSIRTWILAKDYYSNCNSDFVQGLYFYSSLCEECVGQGVELDQLQKTLTKKEKNIVIFTIDYNSDNSIVKFLKKEYNITGTPSLIINNEVFIKELFSAEEIIEKIGIEE